MPAASADATVTWAGVLEIKPRASRIRQVLHPPLSHTSNPEEHSLGKLLVICTWVWTESPHNRDFLLCGTSLRKPCCNPQGLIP